MLDADGFLGEMVFRERSIRPLDGSVPAARSQPAGSEGAAGSKDRVVTNTGGEGALMGVWSELRYALFG